MVNSNNFSAYSVRRRLSENDKTSVKRSKPVILIVEDEENLTDLLAMRLKSKQYTTLIANDGKSACKMVENNIPDLILLDIMLPEKDG